MSFKIVTDYRYKELLYKEMKLQALEEAGVDNWDSYDWAMTILKDLEAEEKD